MISFKLPPYALSPLAAQVDAAVAELIAAHNIACKELTERQLADVLKQALACGDFQRLVSSQGQAVIYEPFATEQRLRVRIRLLEQKLATIQVAAMV